MPENIFNPELTEIISFCVTCEDNVILGILNASREQQIWGCECPHCGSRTLIDRYGYEILTINPDEPVDRFGYELNVGDTIVMRMMQGGWGEEFDDFVIEGEVVDFIAFPVDNPLAIFIAVQDDFGDVQRLHPASVMRADLYWSLYLPKRFDLPVHSVEITKKIMARAGKDY